MAEFISTFTTGFQNIIKKKLFLLYKKRRKLEKKGDRKKQGTNLVLLTSFQFFFISQNQNDRKKVETSMPKLQSVLEFL